MAVTAVSRASKAYPVALAVLLASLALFLLTVVDVRRGFLFPLGSYLKIGAPSAILYLDPRHIPLLMLAALGTGLGYWYLRRVERDLKSQIALSSQARLLATALGALLIIDLFTYRGVPASRILAAGTMGVSQAIPLGDFPAWLKPLGEAANYFLLVWHATFLAVLIGGLFLTVSLPLIRRLGGGGFGAHLAGAALAMPQPFCSCCAAPIGSALYRTGASLGPVLAFTVSAPMLNVTSLILASALLPPSFAILRIGGGVVVGVLVTYAAARIASRWVGRAEGGTEPGRVFRLSDRLVAAFNRLFQFSPPEGALDSPWALMSQWLGQSWRLARVVVSVLFVGSLLAAIVVRALPAGANNAGSMAGAAVLGTLLMVPTWTEIPVAAGLIGRGLSGPAAALLLTLPAVSLPCLLVLAGALRSFRVALVLGFLVFLTGILAGAFFL